MYVNSYVAWQAESVFLAFPATTSYTRTHTHTHGRAYVHTLVFKYVHTLDIIYVMQYIYIYIDIFHIPKGFLVGARSVKGSGLA